ncbi:MAG: hypothetical protein L7F78_12760 [Syntrophales bacterium LBB04]|nr:hypothetical protein [Syntrophales bacterium LBB04]
MKGSYRGVGWTTPLGWRAMLLRRAGTASGDALAARQGAVCAPVRGCSRR